MLQLMLKGTDGIQVNLVKARERAKKTMDDELVFWGAIEFFS